MQRRAAERRSRRAERLVPLLGIAVVVAAGAGFGVARLERTAPTAAPHSAAHSTTAPYPPGAWLAHPDVATAYLAAGTSDVAAVTTYDYRDLDGALSAGLAVTTGSYQSSFRAALTGSLGAAARAEHAVHTFATLAMGVGAINAAGTEAKILVFGDEQVSDDQTGNQPDGTPVTLCVTMVRYGNRYLISDLVQDANPGLPAGSPGLLAAAEAARTQVAHRVGGAVTAIAVERAAGAEVTLLVAVSGGATDEQRYRAALAETSGSWTVTQLQAVDGS